MENNNYPDKLVRDQSEEIARLTEELAQAKEQAAESGAARFYNYWMQIVAERDALRAKALEVASFTGDEKLDLVSEDRDRWRNCAARLAAALKFVSMPVTGTKVTVESLMATIANDDAVALKALADFERMNGDEK